MLTLAADTHMQGDSDNDSLPPLNDMSDSGSDADTMSDEDLGYVFSDVKDGDNLVATGLEFIHGGTTHRTHANKEVIITAGSASRGAC